MIEFLNFFNDTAQHYPMHLDIGYSKTTDWIIHIYKRNCVDDGSDLCIVLEQELDMDLCFAKAHVALKEWLLANEGGY